MGTAVTATETTLDKARVSLEKVNEYAANAEDVAYYVLAAKEATGDDADTAIVQAVDGASRAANRAEAVMLYGDEQAVKCEEEADIAVYKGRIAQNLVKDIAGLLEELSDAMSLAACPRNAVGGSERYDGGQSGFVEPAMSKTYLPYDPDQQLLLPAALREWLPEDHLAYFISDLVDQLDLSEITARYEGERRGAGHPTIPG